MRKRLATQFCSKVLVLLLSLLLAARGPVGVRTLVAEAPSQEPRFVEEQDKQRRADAAHAAIDCLTGIVGGFIAAIPSRSPLGITFGVLGGAVAGGCFTNLGPRDDHPEPPPTTDRSSDPSRVPDAAGSGDENSEGPEGPRAGGNDIAGRDNSGDVNGDNAGPSNVSGDSAASGNDASDASAASSGDFCISVEAEGPDGAHTSSAPECSEVDDSASDDNAASDAAPGADSSDADSSMGDGPESADSSDHDSGSSESGSDADNDSGDSDSDGGDDGDDGD